MAIPGIDAPLIRRAIRVYLEVAFGDDAHRRWPPLDFEACTSAEDALTCFTPDQKAGRMRRFALRLGNKRYPLMKLILQELLVRDRFFFAVDTHDQLSAKQSMKDYEVWLELKRFNARVKEDIERAWVAGGVPTFSAIVAEVEREAPPPPDRSPGEEAPLILIVDDDIHIARGVDAILKGQGYQTQVVHSAEDGLAWLEGRKPALILSDLEMGGITGLEFASKVREDTRLASVPFILATAARVEPTSFTLINAFLVKPYETRILIKFVQEHIAAPVRPSSGPTDCAT